MTTTSSVLSLPFRRSTSLSLATAIRQYISKNYDQHPDMFYDDLETVDKLRRDAVNVREPHDSGIRKLQVYAAQLVWMGGKFPIDIGVDFTWYPALGYNTEQPLVANNLKYELINVLYNLAALYSQLALVSNQSSDDEIKVAANNFALAAGVLTHIKKEILPELRMSNPPDDLDQATLESLTRLFLAQCQECYWRKAISNGFKDGSIAKLAAKVSDLYVEARDLAINSQAISSSWIHHMSAKHQHFAAAAQYRQACDCLERRKYGEEIARLEYAIVSINDGLKECKGGYLSKSVVEDLQKLKGRVAEDLKRAEKDNDLIYLQAVPPKSELELIKRHDMAEPRIPASVAKPLDHMVDTGDFGLAMFAKLIPFAVHLAVSIYEERRDRLVNKTIIAELEALTEKLHDILSSLNLPGSLQALEKPLGIPSSVTQRVEEMRQADAVNRLMSGFVDIDKLRSNDRAIFEQGKAHLAVEEEEDEQLRRKYGTQRWTRPASRLDPSLNGGGKLWGQVSQIEGYLASSTSSDEVVREKFAAVQDTLAILAGSDRGLLDFIPNSRLPAIPETLKPAIGKLRSALHDVQRLESRRRKRIEALQAKARADDIKRDILVEAARLERQYPAQAIVPAHFESFFERRIDSLYEGDMTALDKERTEQEKMLADVQRASRDFEAQKRSVGAKGNRERELALQTLDNAHYKYKEIVSNLEAGRKFYNDLIRIVTQFRDQVRAWVNERRKEARALEEELSMPPLSALVLQQTPAQPPPAAVPK